VTNFLGNVIRWFCVLIWVALIIAFCYLRANGDVAGDRKPEQPYVAFYNPHTYQLGGVSEITFVHPERGKTWTVVRWKPAYAPLLYDENLNFCGNVADKFAGVRVDEEIVIVYSRAISVAREGKAIVACRSLDYVRKMYKEAQ
jgi:hypothetical protein